MKKIIFSICLLFYGFIIAHGQQNYTLEWEVVESYEATSSSGRLLSVEGNVFIAWSEKNTAQHDIHCLMYNEFGEKMWEHEFSPVMGSYVGVYSPIIDNEGDVLLPMAMRDNEGLGMSAIVFAKLSPDGEELWQSAFQHDEPMNSYTIGNWTSTRRIVFDENNNFYTVGMVNVETLDTYFDTMFVVKIDVNGQKNMEGEFQGWGTLDNYIVQGDTIHCYTQNPDTITIYDISALDGTVLGNKGVHFEGLSAGHLYNTQLDNQRNLYVKSRYDLIKYDDVLEELWRYEKEINSDVFSFYKLIFDESGNVYGLGGTYVDDSNSVFENVFITKLDSTGVLKWEVQHDFLEGVVGMHNINFLYKNDYIYLAGQKNLEEDSTSIFLFKYDTGGNKIAVIEYDNPETHKDVFQNIIISAEDDIYISGIADDIPFLLKYSILTNVDTPENTLFCQITPNPFVDGIHITIEDDEPWEEVEINLYNIQGKLILKEKRLGNAVEVKIDDIPVGVYQLEVKKGGLRCVKKVVHQ